MGLKEFGIAAGIIVLWFVLSRWVLPALGVKT